MMTGEFRHVFVAETDRLLRRRLVLFASIWMSLTIAIFLVVGGIGLAAALNMEEGGEPVGLLSALAAMGSKVYGSGPQFAVAFGLTLLWLGYYGATIYIGVRKRPSTRTIVRLSISLILLDGLFAIATRAAGVPNGSIAPFLLSHFVACCLFPWRPGQAVLPIVMVLPVSIGSAILIEGDRPIPTLIGSAIIAALMLPAVGICWWRHNSRLVKSSNRFLRERYGAMRQELAYARQVHEALFPGTEGEGSIRLSYEYEPMRQIGGDYIHASTSPTDNGRDERLSVVLLDVTGHGIPAALTVNRLHGEIDLRFAEDPDIAPGELLRRLNRYVHLTLSNHSIFVTALCLRADPERGVLEYASGGHPPAFLRSVDGTIHDLDSTAFVLGACSDEDFEPVEVAVDFKPGDSVIAYTDGATEARDPEGKMLRIAGLRGIIADDGATTGGPIGQGGWPERMLGIVASHRKAPPEDDTLIVELYRPLGGGQPASASVRAQQPEPAGAAAPEGD